MTLKSLIPWSHTRSELPVRRERGLGFPMWVEDFERLFEDFASEWGLMRGEGPAWQGAFMPRINVAESEKEMTVSAELPGMDEKDIDISSTDDTLCIQGEKKEEREEGQGEVVRSERYYGKFRRDIPLMGEYDAEKAEAEFSKGVLTVRLPRKEEARTQRKHIEVKSR